MSNVNLAVQFFLQIAVILLACRAVGVLASRFGQPQVVAEMIAGVLLGPSLFGLLMPEWQTFLFPWDKTQVLRDTQSYLFPAAQLGLALYMFVVGMEFRVDLLREQFRCSMAVSITGMIAPFVLGAGLAWYLFHNSELFPSTTSVSDAMLFLGASMCITAFPMLARIIQYKGLSGTTMGTVAIGAGAIGDAAAWALLAVLLASFDGDATNAMWSIGGGLVFTAITVFGVRPVLTRFERRMLEADGTINEAGMIICLACMSLGAWFTDLTGLHAVFGAFIVGTAIPRGPIVNDLINRIQPLTVALLLPLFFTYSGLNTQIGLLTSVYLWVMCAVVLFVAVVGKGVSCWLAARATGISNREAMGIGVLMNARGLMELIIINIGLQRGIISRELFAIMVVMAVVTTLMTSPLFDRLVGSRASAVSE